MSQCLRYEASSASSQSNSTNPPHRGSGNDECSAALQGQSTNDQKGLQLQQRPAHRGQTTDLQTLHLNHTFSKWSLVLVNTITLVHTGPKRNTVRCCDNVQCNVCVRILTPRIKFCVGVWNSQDHSSVEYLLDGVNSAFGSGFGVCACWPLSSTHTHRRRRESLIFGVDVAGNVVISSVARKHAPIMLHFCSLLVLIFCIVLTARNPVQQRITSVL